MKEKIDQLYQEYLKDKLDLLISGVEKNESAQNTY